MENWHSILAAGVLGGATCGVLTLTGLALAGSVSLDLLSALGPSIIALATFFVILAQYYLSGLQWRSALLLGMTKEKERMMADTNLVCADLVLLEKLLPSVADQDQVDLARNRFFNNSAMATVRAFASADTNRTLNDLILALADRSQRFSDAPRALVKKAVELVLRDSASALASVQTVYFQMVTMPPWVYRRRKHLEAQEILKATAARGMKLEST